jgi:hypothetical protein
VSRELRILPEAEAELLAAASLRARAGVKLRATGRRMPLEAAQ